MNVSEGRAPDVVDAIAAAAGAALLDVHHDPDHHRAVLTLAGSEPARAVAAEAVARLDLRGHTGVHPRLGVVDVVPFVPLAGSSPADAIAARDAFAHWFADTYDVPCFLYGPERTLPDVRRAAFHALAPDCGPPVPHPTAGACAVGARSVLVAYNLWLDSDDLALAREIAAAIRSPWVRALGLAVTDSVQVSCNLVEPSKAGPADVFDAVSVRAAVRRAELVGLVPTDVLRRTPPDRWEQLDLSPARTIEARLAAAGYDDR